MGGTCELRAAIRALNRAVCVIALVHWRSERRSLPPRNGATPTIRTRAVHSHHKLLVTSQWKPCTRLPDPVLQVDTQPESHLGPSMSTASIGKSRQMLQGK